MPERRMGTSEESDLTSSSTSIPDISCPAGIREIKRPSPSGSASSTAASMNGSIVESHHNRDRSTSRANYTFAKVCITYLCCFLRSRERITPLGPQRQTLHLRPQAILRLAAKLEWLFRGPQRPPSLPFPASFPLKCSAHEICSPCRYRGPAYLCLYSSFRDTHSPNNLLEDQSRTGPRPIVKDPRKLAVLDTNHTIQPVQSAIDRAIA